MKTNINLKMQTITSLLLILSFFSINPPEAKACVDPETIITVKTNYSSDLTEIAIVLGNLKFMEEEPNVFCSCALGGYTDFFTHLEYVAFVQTGTTTPYPNMEPWTNTVPADDAWNAAASGFGDWGGFIAEVINSGLGPDDDVELIIRASTPPGYFVEVSDMDTTLVLSYLGTDAWDPVAEDLFADHQGVRNIGNDNSSITYVEVSDDYFTSLDEGITSTTDDIRNDLSFDLSPNPTNGAFLVKYNLNESSSVTVNLRDITGRVIYAHPSKEQPDGRQELLIDIPEGVLQNGIYVVEIFSDTQRGYQKLLISN